MGVTDFILADACRKAAVPTPSSGHWTKVSLGKVSEPIPLPPAPVGVEELVIVGKVPRLPPAVQDPKEPALPKVAIPDLLRDPHPMVAEAKASLERQAAAGDATLHWHKTGSFQIRVGPESLDRVLRFLDAVLRAVEAHGHPVSHGRWKWWVTFGEAHIGMRLDADYEEVPRKPKPDDLKWMATLSPSSLNVFSMFAGICGMEVASEIFGGRIVPKGVAEILKHQSAVIAQRFPHIKNWGDVTKIDWAAVLKEIASEIHVLTAGFPCQDISIAGLRKGFKGKRSVLFYEVIRAIMALKPRYVILENVKALFHTDQRATLKAVVRAMSRAGYVMDVDLLDARDDGLPMSRERMYAVAVRKDTAKHLPRRVSHRKGLAQNALDAVGYKGIGGYLSAPSVAKPSWLNDFIDRDFDPALLMTATQRAECLKKLDSGDQVIPERWMFFPNDNHGAVADTPEVFFASGVTNTLPVNGRSFGQGGGGVRAHSAFTLTTHKGFAVAYQGIVRFLKETEMERLMGFDPGHTAVTVGGRNASYNQRMKALGNSMAVPSAARALQAVLTMEYFAAAA
jgi:DNA (cytosine-5)-methyltransferase 1